RQAGGFRTAQGVEQGQAALEGMILDGRDASFPDTALGHVYDARQGRAVQGIGNGAQVGHQILDFLALVETGAPHDQVRNAVPPGLKRGVPCMPRSSSRMRRATQAASRISSSSSSMVTLSPGSLEVQMVFSMRCLLFRITEEATARMLAVDR